ncbi:MAG: hypothetical protein DHS20C18_45380 [Saprospiraceae bacterium]|nr:MAG: hypothetical protein DHS20C18_45380 [Saprospiraceae bacterium]
MLLFIFPIVAQQSVARQWNEQVLEAIRKDFARPTVHARNLFHTSTAMYDAWAAYEPDADTYFLGKTVHGFKIPFREVPIPNNTKAAQEEAMSFAVYRLIKHRFQNAPFARLIETRIDFLMNELGYNIDNTSINYLCGGGPAELGNYIAYQIIEYGLQDGSNEANGYVNQFYQPVNPPLSIEESGNPDILDLDRWQPLKLATFIDQAGNPIGDNVPAFLGPEWGSVLPFSLNEEEATNYERDGFNYKVYHDPGPPALIKDTSATDIDNLYKWGHTLVSVWSSHLAPNDPTKWDISPASRGNISTYPTDIHDYPNFYNLLEGGDIGTGRAQNPKTGLPYEPNIVKRSDYGRVLAEFWADGPNSETPPGHWFTILNTVNDHPDLEKRFMGTGEVLDDLEWDVKSYFILGGAMHDVAITAWGIKGWYDYIRPVSAIRAMAEYGQGSKVTSPSYHALGLPLIPGFVELITAGDPLQGPNGQYIGEVKIYAWKGPDFIDNPMSDVAGVGWIRALNWWPYQRPSFVTPPFAGYISGHSTFSRAAAEVLTALTGDPFFPGGIGEFECPKNEFLVFEDGPSEDITLQWATYRDASDQCSLSRIWGGIHPPMDDIPGRFIGEEIGVEAFNFALPYFTKTPETPTFDSAKIFPNPTNCGVVIQYQTEGTFPVQVFHIDGKIVSKTELDFQENHAYLDLESLPTGIYIIIMRDTDGKIIFQNKVVVK